MKIIKFDRTSCGVIGLIPSIFADFIFYVCYPGKEISKLQASILTGLPLAIIAILLVAGLAFKVVLLRGLYFRSLTDEEARRIVFKNSSPFRFMLMSLLLKTEDFMCLLMSWCFGSVFFFALIRFLNH